MKQTIINWVSGITAMVFWAFMAGAMDEQKRRADERVAIETALIAKSARIAAAYALCQSENATPVWETETQIKCLTTKGRMASRQVVAVAPWTKTQKSTGY